MPTNRSNRRKTLTDQEIIARAQRVINESGRHFQGLIASARQLIQRSRHHLDEFWRQMDELENRQIEFDRHCHHTHAVVEKCTSRAEAALKRFSNAAGI